MAKLDNLRRLMVEDFKKDERSLISRLSEILNPFMSQIINSYKNNLTLDNLNQEIITFDIIVDANGNPSNAAATVIKKQLKLKLNRRVQGIWVINAKNQTTSTNYPTAAPFIDFSQSQNLLQINKINGLQNAEEYKLTAIIIYVN